MVPIDATVQALPCVGALRARLPRHVEHKCGDVPERAAARQAAARACQAPHHHQDLGRREVLLLGTALAALVQAGPPAAAAAAAAAADSQVGRAPASLSKLATPSKRANLTTPRSRLNLQAALTVGPGQRLTSIGAALAAAPPGATITVQGGRYAERLVITQAVSILAAPGAAVELAWATAEPYQAAIQVAATAGVRVVGLTVRHSSPSVADNYAVQLQVRSGQGRAGQGSLQAAFR